MRPIYKNQLFNYLKSSSIGVENFDFKPTEGPWNHPDIITYRGTQLRFLIRTTENNNDLFDYAYYQYAPGFTMKSYTNGRHNFSLILDAFRLWIIDHVQTYITDLETPDQWSEYDKYKVVLEILNIDYNTNERFTEDETQKLSNAINKLENRMIDELQLNSGQILDTKRAFDYVRNKLRESDKVAWKLFFLGTIINLIFVLSLDTERGNRLFEIIKEIFQSLWSQLKQNLLS